MVDERAADFKPRQELRSVSGELQAIEVIRNCSKRKCTFRLDIQRDRPLTYRLGGVIMM